MSMEVDVLYRVPKDLCWRLIKRYTRPDSVDIAFYRSCIDPYVTKKTIWNAISRVKPGGIFFIFCLPENISDVIRWTQDCNCYYSIMYMMDEFKQVLPIVAVTRNRIASMKLFELLIVTDMEEGMTRLIGQSNFGDLVMFVGDSTIPYIPIAKQLGRYVVAFGDGELESIRQEAISIEEVDLE